MNRTAVLNFLKKMVPTVAQLAVVAAILVTAFVAYNLGAGRAGGNDQAKPSPVSIASETIYTCSMHPQIRQSEPGSCPICGMELVPVTEAGGSAHDHASQGATSKPIGYACAMNCLPPMEEPGPCPICGMEMQPVYADGSSAGASASPRRLVMSPEAVALSRIQTARVERRAAMRTVRLVGELTVDPRRRAHISANVGGRVDALMARFVGDRVERGQHVVTLYSPELLNVQHEFLQAISAMQRGATTDSPTAAINKTAVESMRERLRLAGLTLAQVDEIAERGTASEHVQLLAPAGGVVIERYVEEGDYVAAQQRILTVADLGVLWVELEAFESDLPWLRAGQYVTLNAKALPGRTFEGVVTWIDPMTNTATRTTRVRIDVENGEGLLKPGMYITAEVHASLDGETPLIIPASAPLITGKRAIAYVDVSSDGQHAYEGREIVLGPRTDDGYVVVDGLREGDRVVTNGAFRIDSALQIIARPSMMSLEGGVAATGHEGHVAAPDTTSHSVSVESFRATIEQYLKVQEALAEDDHEAARMAWNELAALRESDHEVTDIASLRSAFHTASNELIALIADQGNPTDEPLNIAHCPMAFEWKGADWIQTGADIRNPYFGAQMYRCGTVREEVPPQ
jgi:Cu(I)/Ag(I) efflux system membrane fusion protein